MPRTNLIRAGCHLIAVGILLTGCHREERELRSAPPSRARPIPVRVSALQPGPAISTVPVQNKYYGNAYAISEGERLFAWYNCTGCHAHGGGSIGPALMDSVWTYGSSPEQIHASIAQGRPNGMPSWGGHIPDDQIWEIVAYVRSLSALQPQAATPARADQLPKTPDRR